MNISTWMDIHYAGIGHMHCYIRMDTCRHQCSLSLQTATQLTKKAISCLIILTFSEATTCRCKKTVVGSERNSSSDIPTRCHTMWCRSCTVLSQYVCAVADLWNYEVQLVGHKTLHGGEGAGKSMSERNNGRGQIMEH